MAVPSSGAISLKGIHQEIRTNDYSTAIFDGNPISLEDCSRGIEGTINTANASDDRPDGLTPHAMSEFYAYDHDKVAVGSYGNSSSTQMFSGDQGTGLVTVSGIDLSAAAYAGASIIGNTGHIFFRFESGTSFRSDAQVRRINYNSTERWSSFATAGFTGIQTTSLTTNTAYDHSATFIDIATATTAGRWNHRNGTPPSSGTGVNGDTIYYESSGAGASKDVYLRFPEITFSSNTIDFTGYGYGSNMGTLFLGIYITG
jgi:hypothetical protein